MLSKTPTPNGYANLLEECIHYLERSLNLPSPIHLPGHPLQWIAQILRSMQQICQWTKAPIPEGEPPNYNLLVYGEADADILQDAELEYDFSTLIVRAPGGKIPEMKPDGLVYCIQKLSEDSITECRRIRDQLQTCHQLATFLVYESFKQPISQLKWLASQEALILLDACLPDLSTTILILLHHHRVQISRMLDQLFANLPDPAQKPATSFQAQLDTAIERLLPHENFDVRTLCRAMHYSRSQLSRKVRRATGLSITHYVNHYKLEKSRLLLTATDWPIGRIATELGYSSQQYYSALFRKKYGHCPRVHREQHTVGRQMRQ